MEWLQVAGFLVWNVLFYGVIVWVIVRLVRGRRAGERGDHATSVRRLFVYGLMFATLMLAAAGTTTVLQEVLAPTDDEDARSSALALGLALVIVAGPAYALLLRFAGRRLRESQDERRSFGWVAYLDLSLLVSLIVTIVATQILFEGVVGARAFEAGAIVPVVVWGGVWAMHWFWMRAAYGLPGDLHLAAGSVTGLITLAIGVGGIVYTAGDAVYTSVVEELPTGHEAPELGRWLIAAALGAAVWSWHWLARYRHAERSDLWHTHVVVVGALGGLLASIAAAAVTGYWTLVWFVGDATDTAARDHFEYVIAAAVAVGVVGATCWQYHRWVLQIGDAVERTEPLRTYDYVMSGTGLVAAVVAGTLALVAAIEAITPETEEVVTSVANRVILAGVLGAIGVPLWLMFWTRLRHEVATGPAAELGSMVRRTYLVLLFGVGGVVVLVGLVNVLYVAIEDLLDGTLGSQTLRSMRVALSLLVTVTGVAWYHLVVFRSDRATPTTAEPPVPLPAPKHVLLIAPRDPELTDRLVDELVAASGADVETWYRADSVPVPHVDPDRLAVELSASDADDVLVVLGPAGATVTPFETDR